MMSMLLIALANGWTVLYNEVDIDDRLEIFIPICALVVMVHVMVSALTFVDIDATHKYHDYAGIQGFVLFACKLILFAAFTWQFLTHKDTVQKKQRSYYNKLYFVGSGFMLAIPMSIITSYMFAPYER